MNEDKTILYDILEPYEWPVRTEIIPGEVPRSVWRSLATTAKGCIQYGVQKIAHSLRSIPPLSVCQLLTNTISWKIALSSDGNLLAVLQENHVELRCLDDDFAIAMVKCGVSVDSHPQWRKMAWNEESTCLAVVNSSGEVSVISSNGQRLCHIDNKASEEKGLSQAAAGLSFMPTSSQHTSSVAQLIVTNISGLLSCYVIKTSGQYSLLHTFSFTSYYPYGVGSVLYHPQHSIIIVAAVCSATDGVKLSKWRILDSAPHYAMIEGEELVKKSSSILSSVGQLLPYQQPSNNDDSWVFNMELSPSGSVLASLDVSGNISLYEVPSLRLRKQWSIEEQFDALHAKEDNGLSGSPAKLNRNDVPRPFDISWWSEHALVVVNNQGSLTVSNIKSFDNLLGASAEKCEPLVCLSSAHNSSLLFLECEQSTTSMTTPLESVTGSIESEDVSPTKRAVKHLLYSLTELETFQPPRKKPRVISRTYRLVCLKSTTPQELYRRKIDNEEYGDALQLARTYQLDCDLVYQRQWITSPISKATIEDYLSRVSKQHWVMSECLHRVTDDYNAMNDLLKYGLIRTGISEVVTDLSVEVTDTHLVEEVLRGIKRFTDDQMSLVECRIKLLSYLDRLSLMQEILGGPVATDEHFSGTDFHSFRDRSLVELAVDYAQQGNWKAVDLLFSYHGDHTLPHRLAILSNFPETISPDDYAALLPAVDTSGVLIPWQQESWRDKDWCELEVCRRLLPPGDEQKESAGEFLYQESPQMITYKSATNHNEISMWYHERAREIERLSGEVVNSLTLIEIARDYGITNTGVIYDDLLTLKSIVFECGVDIRLGLANLEKMTASDKLMLLMKEVEPGDFADCFQKYTTPFLQRQEMRHLGTSEKLLTDYLCVLAKDDLRPCLCIFKTAHTKCPAHPLLTDMVKLVQLILDCMYSCERTDQLSIADQIFECIPEEKDNDSGDLVQLHRKVDALDNHLHAVELLQQYEIEKPIVYIRTIEDNIDEAKKLMIRITRSASRRKPPMKETDWLKLSEQLLGLQRNIFKCLGENICYKIIAEALLSSGLHGNITLGGQLLAHSSQQHPIHGDGIPSADSAKRKKVSAFVCKISFRESVELVLSASREYFNSAGDSSDHEMALARCCLDLIKEPVDDVIAERQLIEAIGILATCQVAIIPVQVRLCEHKLDIVKQALQSSPALCKDTAKVLTLGKLLGLKSAKGGVNTLTGDLGQAMILVVHTAMKHSEFDVALEVCHQLMSMPTPDAWEVCRYHSNHSNHTTAVLSVYSSELATVGNLQDLQIRTSLLQFALTHCPTGEIKRILQILHTVETEDLYQQCTTTSSSSDTVKQQQSATGGVLQLVGYNTVQQLVNKSTGIVQQLIRPDAQSRDSGKMSSYLNWMSSAATALNDYWRSTASQVSPSAPSSSSEGHLNSSQLVQLYHPFYDNNFTASSNDYIVLRPTDHSSSTLQLHQAILRTTLLLADYSQPCGDVSETLLSMAWSCATTNLPLFLAYLLALPDPMMAKTLFQRLEPNMLTLHIAIYYVCLQISVLVNNCDSSLYLLPPATVVAHVTSHMTSDHSDWPEKAKELVEFLKELNTQLGDLMQAKTLQEFDLDIDVEKFTQDSAYKHQVIMMLVRNMNSTYLSTGMKLASRYGVPRWEVLMEHLDWLLTESKLTNQVMQNHISQIGVDDVALQKPQQTVDHLMTVIYPRIAGTNHSSLLVCLSLMERCVGRGAKDTQLVDISMQIKLLKKFKSSLQAVDFKAVMCGQDPLMVLQPHLTSENVHVVAKVATKIPLSCGGHLQASDIFQTFAEKLFWDIHPNKEKGNTEDIDWLHRYRHCQEYLERLSTTQYEAVIKNITISPMALKLVPADVRMKIVQECIKFSRSKSCKMDSLEEKLQQLKQHLKIVNDKTLSPLASKEEWKSLYEEFAMSDAETAKVHTLVIKMLMAGLDQQFIANILTLTHSVVPHSLQISSLVCEALEMSLCQLSDDKCPNKEGLLAISNILDTCWKSKDATLTDIVLNILSDYYKSSDHSADARIAVLELIEQTNALPPEDIVRYKTEAILYDQFDVKIDHGHMTSCDGRRSLVEQLLTQAVNMDQLLTIVKLLQLWPDPVAAHVASWGDLLVQLSLQPDGRGHVLLVRAGLEGIPLEADVKLYENLSNDFTLAFKVAVTSRQETLLHRAMEDATVHFTELSSDCDVLELIMQCGQVHCIVNTPLYSSLHHYLLTDNCSSDNLTMPLFATLLHCSEEEVKQTLNLHRPMDRVRTAAEQLYNHGYWLEAGAMLLRSHRTHPALVTTGNAVSMLHKLF